MRAADNEIDLFTFGDGDIQRLLVVLEYWLDTCWGKV